MVAIITIRFLADGMHSGETKVRSAEGKCYLGKSHTNKGTGVANQSAHVLAVLAKIFIMSHAYCENAGVATCKVVYKLSWSEHTAQKRMTGCGSRVVIRHHSTAPRVR